jgi:hypothetical protein
VSAEFSHRQWRLAVLSSRELTDGQKVDILTRGEHWNFEAKDGTNSTISHPKIAKINGHKDLRSVIRSTRAGEAAGLLSLSQERKGSSSVYRLTMPPLVESPPLGEEPPLVEEPGVPLGEEPSPPGDSTRGPLGEEPGKDTPKEEGNTPHHQDSASRGDEGSDTSPSGESATPPPGPSAARAEHEDRDFNWERLAGKMKSVLLPDADPRRLASRLRAVARQHDLDVGHMIACTNWWTRNGADTEFGIWQDGYLMLEFSGVVSNITGWFWKILPDLVAAWVAAGQPSEDEEYDEEVA